MRVRIQDIPEEGLEVQETATPEALDLSPQEVVGGVRYRAQIFRDGETLLVEGDLETLLQLQCSRCLEVFRLPAHVHFSCREEPAWMVPQEEEEVELHREDLDVGYYQGDSLELLELIREQVLLAIPMRPLCREDCLGLCPQCGQNWNQGRCDCRTEQVDPRWAALAQWVRQQRAPKGSEGSSRR